MNAFCTSFELCGGCQFQNYEESIQTKQQEIESLFPHKKINPILKMEDPYHYRHKIYATFGKSKRGHLYAGLYEEDSHRLVSVQNCAIQNQSANAIIQSIVEIANKLHIEPFNEKTKKGCLRHAYFRVSHSNNDVLLVLVIGSRELPGSKILLKELTNRHKEIKTILLSHNDAHTSMILGKDMKLLYGKGYIIDTIQDISFRISPESFYQVNPVQTEKLYSTAIELAQLKGNESVLDACCGIGTITLLAAKKAQYVIGMEINPDAIKDAKENAKHNHINNVDFYCADADDFIENLEGCPDVVFLDPPRSGFSKKFIDQLCHLKPKKIVYVSCNPITQVRDTKQFQKLGYQIKKIQPVDLFPFTKHLENVVLMKKV